MILQGRKGVIFGVANQKSLAWGIAQACHKQGAELAFTYLNEMLGKRVIPLAESLGSKLILECDVQDDAQLDQVFKEIEQSWGKIDFLIHSVAYAHAEDLRSRFLETSREGFKLALDISAYSLIALAKRVAPVMKEGGSIVTLTYLGSTRVVHNYRLMGICRAALESCVRELACDLGSQQIRVNAISAGPIKTLAASGISEFKQLLTHFEGRAPLHRLTTIEEVGATAAFLVSNLASGITGENIFVDSGFNITAI